MNVLEHPAFVADYAQLAQVSLDPARHTAPHAHAHCEQVAARAEALARRHCLDPRARERLVTLARVHDIGKLAGHARPAASVERLKGYGIDDPELLALVKVHDTNLPWWQSWRRGEAPTERAWKRLARKVDLHLLALFMIADRVDAPGGWRANGPLMWFLGEAIERGLLSLDLDAIDEPGPGAHAGPGTAALDVPAQAEPSEERCAGALLWRWHEGEPQVLLIRVRAEMVWELPKGHIEPGEDAATAAARELAEEAGTLGPIEVHARVGSRRHSFVRGLRRIDKHVEYFTVHAPSGTPTLGPCPRRTRERRWVSRAAVCELPLVSESLRSLIADGLALIEAHRRREPRSATA